MDPKPTAPKPFTPSDAHPSATSIGRSCDPRPAPSRVDMTALIRSIQRTEGESPCFRIGLGDCDRTDCPWRRYCL